MYTVGTAYILQGESNLKGVEYLENCIDLVERNNKEVKKKELYIHKGYAYNNIAMGKFWEFVQAASSSED